MPILQVYVDDTAHERLSRASLQTGRTIEDLATSAVEETALDWEKANTPGTKGEQHPMKAGIQQDDQPDLHRHPIHDAIETDRGGEA